LTPTAALDCSSEPTGLDAANLTDVSEVDSQARSVALPSSQPRLSEYPMLSLKEDGDAAGLSGALPSNLLRVPGSPPALGLLRISLPGSVGPARNDRRKRHSKAVRASRWRSA